MTVNVYLHKEIADTLMCFGDLSKVVNDILAAGADGAFDIMDKERCPSKDNCEHYRIDITEPYYLSLYELYGPKSSHISIRRLLYWFVENEIFDELGWSPQNIVVNTQQNKFKKKIQNAITELNRAIRFTTKLNVKEKLSEIINQLGELE